MSGRPPSPLQLILPFGTGYNFSGELATDDWSNTLREVAAIKAYQRSKGSSKPYAVLGYRGIVVGPPAIWHDVSAPVCCVGLSCFSRQRVLGYSVEP